MATFRKIAAVFFCLVAGAAMAANTKGSNIKNPLSMKVGSSSTVTLVNEYDPELKENFDSGASYIKVSLTKGYSYTVWIQGGDASSLLFVVDTDIDDDNAPFATFDYDSRDDDSIQIAYLYADQWDVDDPSTGTYYIQLFGEIGQKTTVSIASGIRSFVQEGEEGNPRRLKPTEQRLFEERSQVGDGDFYYVMHMEEGRKYRIWVAGATMPVGIETTQVGDLSPEADALYNVYFNALFPGYSSANGVGYVVYPTVSGDYVFNMSTKNGAVQNFKMMYQAFKKLLPEEHKNKVILSESNGYSAKITPGRENSDGIDYYDNVIDETLCKVAVSKGDRRVFETSGATNAVLMRVYSADGSIVSENGTKGNGSFDVRAAMTAAYDGAYYVGVCQPSLIYSDKPDAAYKVDINSLRAEEFDSPSCYDDYDDGDDTYLGASIIVPCPGTSSNSVVEAGIAHGPHVLSGRDWYDWFCFAGRGGVTYRLKASWAGEEKTDLALRAQVYKMVNGAASVVKPSFGSLTPGSDSAALTFTADEDAMYYVGVSVAEPLPGGGSRNGLGLDFPAYNMHAVGYLDGYSLGLLTVDTHGADGEWTLDDLGRKGKSRYANGATALVVADTSAKVNFQPVEGYTTPAAKVIPSVVAGGEVSVVGRYVDAMDPKDDSKTLDDILKGGYTPIAPVSSEETIPRTLWANDPVDTYVFQAQEGRRYSFGIKDTTEMLTQGTVLGGDAVMDFFAYVDGKLQPIDGLSGVASVMKRSFAPGYVVVKVCHSSPVGFETDSCYALTHKSVNVGTVRFAAATFTAAKDDAYADVVLKRSASEGAISVRYVTVEGTAKPGEDYYPTAGEETISWADGDMSDKTIRVRLIPSLIEKWTEVKSFQVQMAVFAEDAASDDEYIPTLSGKDKATVKILSAAAKDPGTVTLLDQPLEVTAGDTTFSLRLERTGGTEGRIAVALYSTPGTAVEGVDYKNITYSVLEWEDGVGGVKTVPFKTFDRGDVVPKTVNIGMIAVNADYRAAGYGDYRGCLIPKLSTRSAVLTISSTVARETGSLLAAAAAEGVAISTPIGSWYSDGTLRSGDLSAGGYARIGFTVNGPGFLKVDPQIVGGIGSETMIYLVGSQGVKDCTGHSGPMVLTVPAGRQTVLFQVNSPSASGVHAEFSNVDNGLPFKWMPLSTMAADDPISGAVVPAYGVPLSWTAPAGWNKEDVWYRAKLGVVASSVPYVATEETTGLSAAITVPAVANYITNVVSSLGIGQSVRFFWTVECAYSDELDPDFSKLEWIVSPNVWNFAISGPGTPATLVSGTDAEGAAISPKATIELVEGLWFEADLAVEGYVGNVSGCVGGTLPPGLSASGMKISGVPSKAGTYRALVEAGIGKAYATTTELVFHVAEAGTALGSFGGVVVEDGSASPNAALRNLLLIVSAQLDGNISAALNYYGGRLAFSTNTGFADYDPVESNLHVRLSSPVVYSGLTYENSVEIVTRRGSLEDPVRMGESFGEAKVTLWLPDASGVPTERTYVCGCLARSNADSGVFKDAMTAFEGYYTVALAPIGPLAGEPSGNGRLAVAVTSDGIARVSGLLADGASMSMATYANLVGDITDPASCVLEMPVWSSSPEYSLGGTLRLKAGTDVGDVKNVYADACSDISWTKDGASSTYDGAGFKLSLSPVGGWYDTVVNLQRHYIDRDFSVETEPVTGIPEYLRYPGVSYVADTTPRGVALKLEGNVLSPVATRFVMEENGRRVDLSASDNPWNVKFAFERGSGLVSGTFAVISDDGASPQQYAATLPHYGILLMNADPKSPLADVLTAGFYLLPSSKSGWLLSRPFNVRMKTADHDWSEAEIH